MLERIENLSADILGVEAVDTVSRQDYESVIVPLLEDAHRQGRRIRFLYRLGPRFHAFTPGAAWEDARVGMHYLRLFEKCAVVCDLAWVVRPTRLIAAVLPFPLRTFGLKHTDEALRWLEAPVEAHNLKVDFRADKRVAVIEPHGPFTREDFEYLAAQADPIIERHGLNGVVIHPARFPGWANLGTMIRHVQFIRDHHRKVRRVALAADGALPEIMPRLAAHFVKAELRRFAYNDLEAAVNWAGEVTADDREAALWAP